MKKFRLLGLVMAAALALGFTSCKDNNEIDGSASIIMEADAAIVIDAYMDHDPTAAYPLSATIIRPLGRGNDLCVRGGKNNPTAEAIAIGLINTGYSTSAHIAVYPEAKSLKGMKYETAAALSFADTCVSLQEDCGYVVKLAGMGNVNTYNHAQLHDPADLYIRLFCKLEKDGSYRLYYQYPFLPEE